MANYLTTENKYALDIARLYPAEKFNLLTPMQTVTEIAEIHRPVMNVVTISTDLNDKEIYLQEKAKNAYTDNSGVYHAAKTAGYAITKKGLNKLMRAAGIKILGTRPIVPTTCQKCAETNAKIGRPVNCGRCGNEDMKYEARISVPQLTGENIEIVAHKEIIVKDATVGMTDNQIKEFMKFRNEMCETKAINRALRAAMHIKGTYRIEELRKPFVVAYLVPNLDHPDVKAEAIKSMFASTNEVYGKAAQTAPKAVYVNDDDDEVGENVFGAPSQPIDEAPPYEAQHHQQQVANPPAGQAQANRGGRHTCQDCGANIAPKVYEYSVNNFGFPLCMNCQKQYRGGGAK